MNIRQDLISNDKYNLKCPYPMTAQFLIVHNTANDAPAQNEISYMKNNGSSTSFHIAVDDTEVVQGIPFDRNTWNCGDGGDGYGNRNGISIEICYSRSGGDKWEKARANAIELIAQMLNERGWGIDKVKKHQDFNGKYCPHRILDEGWDKFLAEIEAKLVQTPTPVIPNYTYEQFVKDVQIAEGQTGKWIDGIAGSRTLELTPTVSAVKNRTHAVVEPIQKYLYELGYTEVGEADGIAGIKFTSAVKHYQRDNGCIQDGEITARNKTWKKLLRIL